MERRYPLIEIGLEVAKRLLNPLPGAATPSSLKLLVGGHVNTNYIVNLSDAQRLVLRIYAGGEAAFRNETHMLRSLAGIVPVPRLRLAVIESECLEFPYAVLEWVEGVPLNKAVLSDPEAAFQIADALADVLVRLSKQALSVGPSISFVEYIRQCLFKREAGLQLGPDRTARLWKFVLQKGAFLAKLCQRESLLHGDFQGDNILLKRDAGLWRVRSVLDWEWAHRGCYLQDLGSLLRYSDTSPKAFRVGLEVGFSKRGIVLPTEWIMAARIWDIAAQCEKLSYPRHRGEITYRSIQTIEQCLEDYDPK
jgi:aminoglycoside phosphotransferase (APT) family kinase protein